MSESFTTDNKVEVGRYLMPFGKYKGDFVSDIVSEDPKYIDWMLTLDLNPELKEAIEHAQQR